VSKDAAPNPGGPTPPGPSSAAQNNLLIIDEGFDTTVDDLVGKVIGSYTVMCAMAMATPNPVPAPAVDDEADAGADSSSGAAPDADDGAIDRFAIEKGQFVAALAERDESCHLAPGIAAKPDPLSQFASRRTAWNRAMRASLSEATVMAAEDAQQIVDAMQAQTMDFPYHGTTTAGAIAHGAPDVRLVLIERQLGSMATLQASFSCLVQSELDDEVRLLSDPDVQLAYVNRPTDRIDLDVNLAAAEHRVALVNQSFGPAARVTIEALQKSQSCPTIDLGPYFSVLGQLEHAYARAQALPGALTVVAAGNDGARLDGPADSLDCAPDDPGQLMVGSDTLDDAISGFSNFGACVDLFAPGEWVVTPTAGGWLMPVEGTSYSAPLAVRSLSQSAPQPFAVETARASLLARLRFGRYLSVTDFPVDLFYRPAAPLPLSRALTSSTGASGLTTRPARAGPPFRIASRLPSTLVWSRAWRPIMALREIRRGQH
jgi:subtilisin family serine protease